MDSDRFSRRRLLQLTGSAAALGLAGCAGDGGTDTPTTTATATETETETETATATETESAVTPALSVSDQETSDGTVTILSAAIDGQGWLVVHPEAEGGGPNPAVTIAERQLSAGEYSDVELTLDPLESGEQTVYAMLHYDDPADGEFTFPDEGDPAVTEGGEPVITPFAVTASGDGGMESVTTVTMVDVAFDPKRVSVEPGTTVEWVNEDGFAHDVTSAQFHDAAEQWDYAVDVAGGETVSRTFESEGIYEYYCTIHGRDSMCGAVLVGDVSLSGDLPCAESDSGGGGY